MCDYLKQDGSNYDEFIEAIPFEARKIMERIETLCIGGARYEDLSNILVEFEKCGYTFNYYLDAEPYEFKKIGVEVSVNEFWGV